MRKDTLILGDIFNKVYTGTNDAYGRCNGKTTNILTKIDSDKIEMREFYSFTGSITDPQCMSNTLYWNMSSLVNSEYEIIKIQDVEKEGFIHQKVLDLKECYKLGIITKEQVCNRFKSQQGDFIRKNPITTHSIRIGDKENPDWITKHSFSCLIEPFTHPQYPYLICAAFLYDTVEELYNDVDRVFNVKCWHFN
jgi:hypothetical protein